MNNIRLIWGFKVRNLYKYSDGTVVKLSDCKNYASINNGHYVPIKHNGDSAYVVKVITKDNGCPKRIEKLRLK